MLAMHFTPEKSLPERNFQIGIVQMSCLPEPEQNMERAVEHVRDAAAKGAEIICLPELFQTQYFCQREDMRCSISLNRFRAPRPSAWAM